MEAAYREKANGREDYLRKVKEDARLFILPDAVIKIVADFLQGGKGR
jgi:hypothetical protein